MRAPKVPILKYGIIGGIGIKNGRDVCKPCLRDMK
jgi:hypothetical protein